MDDALTMRTMRAVHARRGYLLDPHTAVGVAAAQLLVNGGGGGGGPVAAGQYIVSPHAEETLEELIQEDGEGLMDDPLGRLNFRELFQSWKS